MAVHTHDALKRLFDLVFDAPAAERADLLDRECAGDKELKQRLIAMIAAASDDRFLGTPTGDAFSTSNGAPPDVDPVREGPGTRIGPYKLLQLIGEGGFGSVFMAEQEKPVQRRVALKIIKLGMDTRQVIARFEAERQALAMMDHPNIARVLDAGATEAGRPYFVMELVPGDPITEYCDKHNLTVQERLELFGQVCHAVQHAHQKGIIHRDIKPTNVLVSTQDGRPHARVIDFGIAKATAARLTEKTLFTEHKTLIGTPQYMSPEQAEGGLDIDTRADVYGLGVLLYELLTGSTPFDGMRLRSAAYAEMQRIIREDEPPKPSTRLSSLGGAGGLPAGQTLATVAAHRRLEPRRLGTLVRGELDWIVMKALEKDRARRYETANGLALDVRRFLDGEAVVAAPPSGLYRARKFVRRNRGPVIGAAAVMAALLVGIVGFGWQARRVAAQRDLAITSRHAEETARTAEEGERRKSDAISTFIQNVLESSDPHTSNGKRDMLVADAMTKAVQELDDGAFKDQPEVEAGLRLTVAEILAGNARGDIALAQAERGLAICRGLYKGDHADLAKALSVTARIQWRGEEALAKFKAALEMRKRLFKGDNASVAENLHDLANCLDALDRSTDALPFHEAALEMTQRLHPGDNADVAECLNSLGFCLQSLRRSEEALPKYEAAVEIERRVFKDDHPNLARGLNNVGWCLSSLGRHGEAMPKYEESLKMNQRIYKGDNPDVITGLNNVAFCLGSQGNFADALPWHQDALAMTQRLNMGDDPRTVFCRSNVAFCLQALGKPAEARPHYEIALAMQERLFKGDHEETAKLLSLLARCLSDMEQRPEALARAQQAAAMADRLLPEGHPIRTKCDEILAQITKRTEAARP